MFPFQARFWHRGASFWHVNGHSDYFTIDDFVRGILQFWNADTVEKEKFCRFPHRHGEGRGNPETQNETCWSIKTSISWEAFFNFDTLTLSKRKTRNMKRDMLEHQSEHFMRDVLQVWHVDTIKKKGFTCGLVHLNLATLEPKKKNKNALVGMGVPILEIQIWLWGPKPLQNQEPTKHVATCSLYIIGVPNPMFPVALLWL